MSEMILSDVLREKKQVEERILKWIQAFEQLTGLSVQGVDLLNLDLSTLAKTHISTEAVTLRVEL